MPDQLEEIGAGAFSNCKGIYGTLRMPDKVKVFPRSLFSEWNITGGIERKCGITSVDLNNVEVIERQAFEDMNKLRSVTMRKVKSIDMQIFIGCDSLTSITLPQTLETLSTDAFSFSSIRTININKPSGSFSGAPWGVESTGGYIDADVNWLG